MANVDELFAKIDLDKDGKPEDKEKLARLKELNSQPEIQKALIDAGKSLMAVAIMLSEPIVNDLTPELKAKYQTESDELEARVEKYSKLIEAADPSFKANK